MRPPIFELCMFVRTVICRTPQNKSQSKFRNHSLVKTFNGTKMSCKAISVKKTNSVWWVTHAELLLQDIFKQTAIILLVNLSPFLDLNVLCSCDRLTPDWKACLEIWKFLRNLNKIHSFTLNCQNVAKCTNNSQSKNICRTLSKSYNCCHTIFGA